MTRRAGIFVIAVLLIGLAVGFLYLHFLTNRAKLDTRQYVEEGVRNKLSEAAFETATGATQNITLYFPSDDRGLLLSESRPIAWATNDTDRIRQVLLALIEGSRQGYRRPLPPATEVRAAFLLADGTAYVDFSNNALALYTPGIQSETLAIYSIVNSLARNVPAVKKVRILVQGQEVDTLNGHADLSGDFVPDPSRNNAGS